MSKVLLLAALPVEVEALTELLEDPVERAIAQSFCRQGFMTLPGGRIDLTVAEVGVGSIDSALNTLSVTESVMPDLALFVGIGGGVKDVSIGDVVISTKIHFYESGRDEEQSFRPRPASPWASQSVRTAGKRIQYRVGGDFKVLCGAVAAGDKLVGSSKSQTAGLIRKYYSDALVAEMEGAGFVAAMQRFPKCEYGVIRGVSDLLDDKERTDLEGRQAEAAVNAVYVARDLLTELAESGHLVLDELPAEDSIDLSRYIPNVDPTQSYALVTAPGSQISLAILDSGLPVGLILDLDRRTDSDGVYASCAPQISRRALIRLETPADRPSLSRFSVTWLAVNGLVGRGEGSDLAHWKRVHRRDVRRILELFAKENGGRHLTVLVALDGRAEQGWLAAITDDVIAEFGEACSVLGLGPPSAEQRALQVDGEIRLDAADLAAALRQHVGPISSDVDGLLVPSSAGQDVSLRDEVASWCREELEFVPAGGWSAQASEEAELSFLRGGEIEWSALHSGADILRDGYSELRKTVLGALRNRRTLRLNLFHEPGAGGTTVARRLAFDTSKDYPTVLVRAISPQDTARRIEALSRETGLTPLCVVDSAFLNEGAVSGLVNDLHASHTTAVVVQVGRRFSPPSVASSSIYLKATLTEREAQELFDRYVVQAPESRSELAEARFSNDERRSAFYFGLAAFESDFRGLRGFVASRLKDLSDSQERVVLFAAIAHYYGQVGLPEHSLAGLLGLPAKKAAAIGSVLSPEVRSLLWRSPQGEWRTLHQLVAREILITLGGDFWRGRLADWGRAFAEFSRGSGPVPEQMRRVVQAVFFDRGSQELLGTESGSRNTFARLVEDIPSDSGAAEVLALVASLFPDDAHFAGHVARFFAFRVGNYKRAAVHALRAVDLEPHDSQIHHMLGMVYRAEAFHAIGMRADLDFVEEWGQKASFEFGKARELDPYDEHGYISDIQLSLKVVSYAISSSRSIDAYLRSNPSGYVISCLESAEDLLARVKTLGDPSKPSAYASRSSAELASFYGDYSTALQMLDGLLSQRRLDPLPIRRQLVWTYLERGGQDWQSLDDRARGRIFSLLEENLREGGYSAKDVRQWWRAIRYAPNPPSQDRVFEVLSYWREGGGGVEAAYCSYVAHLTDVLDGIVTAVPDVDRFLKECVLLARNRQDRNQTLDWVGRGQGVQRLVHTSELGGWNRETRFWRDTSALVRMQGRVAEIRAPQAGYIDIQGIRAFFVPTKADLEKGRDDNRLVSGFLGFSHDGPRLWEVRLSDPSDRAI